MKLLSDIGLTKGNRSFTVFFKTPAGILSLLLAGAFLGVVTVKGGLVAGLMLLIAMIGIPVVYGMVAFPVFGICCLMMMAFGLFFIIRFGPN